MSRACCGRGARLRFSICPMAAWQAIATAPKLRGRQVRVHARPAGRTASFSYGTRRRSCSGGPMLQGFQAAWTEAMKSGQFEAAHRISDAVLAAPGRRIRAMIRTCPITSAGSGTAARLKANRILIRTPGLGDTLQFARFLPIIGARAASLQVCSRCSPRSFRCSNGTRARPPHSVQARDVPARPRDCDIEIMELLHALRVQPIQFRLRSRPAFRRFGSLARARALLVCREWDPRVRCRSRAPPAGLRRSAAKLIMLSVAPRRKRRTRAAS